MPDAAADAGYMLGLPDMPFVTGRCIRRTGWLADEHFRADFRHTALAI